MKRLFFSYAAVLLALTCNAQKVQILDKGNVIYEHDISDGIEVVFKDPYNGHEYVDLGLPSGTLWATCNVGASSPEEYGDYFAWGETEPYYIEGHSQDYPCDYWKEGKDGYKWSSYKYCNGSWATFTLTKYCVNANEGIVDNKTTLDLEDDAAYVNWGSNWRMPTDAELTELRVKCRWIPTSINGIAGHKVTGPNGKSIFLPNAGFRAYGNLESTEYEGWYWSNSLYDDSDFISFLTVGNGGTARSGGPRFEGHSVRPVCK